MTIQNIAFLIPTYNRPEECHDTIDTIIGKWPDAKVYVCDDSELDFEFHPKAIYCEILKFDSGVSTKRNLLIEATKEPFIFLLDDDMKVNHINLEVMMTILDNEPTLGLVAARKMDRGKNRWSNSEGTFFINGGILHINRPVKKCHTGLIEWMAVDYAPMCFLARRRVFDAVRFDYRLKTCGEHVDFFLRLAAANGHQQLLKRFGQVFDIVGDDSPLKYDIKDRGNLGVALDVSSYVVDTGSRPDNRYNRKRARGGRFRKQMMARWMIQTIARWNSRQKAKAIY